ncbi:MAG TPA: SurA N-terminal domain-containing protein [Solirubrobacteraceae bacterium]|jgi:hypothetical protein|nr:SurA N-terminal domain-containing protein [Solirubrobacteraceae bacterium]
MRQRAPAISRDRGHPDAARTCGRLKASLIPAFAAIALGGCGSTTSAPLAASVQGSPIGQSQLAHWVAVKRAEQAGSSNPESSSSAQLTQNALRFLITAQWLEKEAAAQGVSVAPSEVQDTYQRLLTGPSGQAFAASLKRRGLSSADELLVLRLGALAQKLRAKIASAHPGLSAAQIRGLLGAFIVAYRERWRQRTTCQPHYLIAECRNGPPLPSPGGAP